MTKTFNIQHSTPNFQGREFTPTGFISRRSLVRIQPLQPISHMPHSDKAVGLEREPKLAVTAACVSFSGTKPPSVADGLRVAGARGIRDDNTRRVFHRCELQRRPSSSNIFSQRIVTSSPTNESFSRRFRVGAVDALAGQVRRGPQVAWLALLSGAARPVSSMTRISMEVKWIQ